MEQVNGADRTAQAKSPGLMQKVIIVGSPGSGKSMFARTLRDRTGLPLYYLDRLWHRADHTTVPEEEFDEKLAEIVDRPQWIMDGTYLRTFWMRALPADTVLWFDLPAEVCLAGVRDRIGTLREDIPWEPETALEPVFEQYVREFPETRRPILETMIRVLQTDKTKQVYVFRSRSEAGRFLDTVPVCPSMGDCRGS